MGHCDSSMENGLKRNKMKILIRAIAVAQWRDSWGQTRIWKAEWGAKRALKDLQETEQRWFSKWLEGTGWGRVRKNSWIDVGAGAQAENREKVKVKVKPLSRVWFFEIPRTVAYHAPPSMGFSMQEYWSGLPFPSPEDFPDPGIEPGSPTLWADALPSEPPGKSWESRRWTKFGIRDQLRVGHLDFEFPLRHWSGYTEYAAECQKRRKTGLAQRLISLAPRNRRSLIRSERRLFPWSVLLSAFLHSSSLSLLLSTHFLPAPFPSFSSSHKVIKDREGKWCFICFFRFLPLCFFILPLLPVFRFQLRVGYLQFFLATEPVDTSDYPTP